MIKTSLQTILIKLFELERTHTPSTRVILSSSSHSKRTHPMSGFTLIELLVVIALIGVISLMALPSVSSYFKVSLNSAAREMGSVIKEAYNATAVTGQVHRIAYDLKNNAYWVEVGPSTVLLDTAATKEREAHKKKFTTTEKDEPPPSAFAMARLVTRNKKNLPRGVMYDDIINEQSTDPIKTGTTYTHFFPQGVTEQTLIHLKDGDDHKISLVISPLLGRTHLYDRLIEKKEAFGN